MTDLRKAAEMALEALERGTTGLAIRAIPALRQALAQPEQEHESRITALEIRVAKLEKPMTDHEKQLMAGQRGLLRTAPPSKPWVSLTDEEVSDLWFKGGGRYEINAYEFVKAIEAALRSKNT